MVVHGRRVDRRIDGSNSERRGRAHVLGPPRGRDQRLGGNAAVVEAVAPHLVSLDERDGNADLGSGGGNREPAGARADHAQVEALLSAWQAALLAGGRRGGLLAHLPQPGPLDRLLIWPRWHGFFSIS